MGNKKKEKKHIKPSMENIKQMDEIVLIDYETMLSNMDIPIFSEDVDSKFLTTELYKDRVRTGIFKESEKIDRIVMRIPQIFNVVCFKLPMGSYVVVKDKGSHIKLTCYNYINMGEDIKILEGITGVRGLDDSWVWQYETDGREIEVQGLYDKQGRYFTTIIANGEIEMNYNFPSFATIFEGLKDKRQGRYTDFERKVGYIVADPSWRKMDVEALLDADNKYSEYMMKKVLQADMAVAIMQYAFTLHIIANTKRYKESVLVENKIDINKAGNTPTIHKNTDRKNTYTINVGKLAKKAKRERAIRQRKESEYKTSSWDVRGHRRKYKDGHTVWIKPSTHKRNEKLIEESQSKVGKKYKINILD